MVFLGNFLLDQFFVWFDFSDLFRLCPPSSVGAYDLRPRAHVPSFYIMIYYAINTCSLTGGCVSYLWGTNGKDPTFRPQKWDKQVAPSGRQVLLEPFSSLASLYAIRQNCYEKIISWREGRFLILPKPASRRSFARRLSVMFLFFQSSRSCLFFQSPIFWSDNQCPPPSIIVTIQYNKMGGIMGKIRGSFPVVAPHKIIAPHFGIITVMGEGYRLSDN